MARRRRRGHRIPWGTRTRAPDDIGEISDDNPFRDPPGHRPPGVGGAGVREPRRPKPAPPSMSAEADDPEPDTFLDFTPAR